MEVVVVDSKEVKTNKLIKVRMDFVSGKYNNCLKGQLPSIKIQSGLKSRFDIVVLPTDISY